MSPEVWATVEERAKAAGLSPNAWLVSMLGAPMEPTVKAGKPPHGACRPKAGKKDLMELLDDPPPGTRLKGHWKPK